MDIKLHKNARTTPAVRYGVTEATIYKWKKRESLVDKSHTADRLQTTLSPAQEAIVVELRKTLLLPPNDLLAGCREFICADVSRSGLDRGLRRHDVGNLHASKPLSPKAPHKTFKAYEPGYVHVDVKYLPQMIDEARRSYLFAVIDRATRWVFVQIRPVRSRSKNCREIMAKNSPTACLPVGSASLAGNTSLIGFVSH